MPFVACCKTRMIWYNGPDSHVDEPVAFPGAAAAPFTVALREAPRVVKRFIYLVLAQLNSWWWKKQPWYKEIFARRDQVLGEQFRKALKTYQREAEKQGRAPELTANVFVDEVRETLYAALPQAIAEGRPPTFEELRSRHVPKGCLVFLVSNGSGFVSPPLVVSASDRSTATRQVKINDHWDEARDLRAFDPERWLVRGGGDGDANAVSFHSAAGLQLVLRHGVQGCWGKKLAQMELRTVVALLVWHFEMLEILKTLTDNTATEGVTRRPREVFMRSRKAIHAQDNC
ncbi:hypothetical protein F5Y12DRAFT_794329 [Xylaria sp. FL1777]|nr:hypothetical protein F5Y12DRAFT_794329 [Xylaria sp. FL1777]